MMNPVAEAALEVLAAGTDFPGLRRALFAAVAGRHLNAGTSVLQVGVAEGEGRLPLEFLLERLPTRPLATLATINKGRTGIKDAMPGPYPLVVTAEERGSSDHFDFEGPGVMIPMVSSTGHGDASLKRVHFQDGQYAVGSILSVVQPRDPEQLSARYLHAYLSSFKDELLVSRMVGTANVSLTVAKIGEVPVPLLPIDAQRKVDELMALCDRLEARQQDAEAAHGRLVRAMLDSLTQARDADEFRACWQRLEGQFQISFSTVESVDKLKQVIRDVAVSGRLLARSAGEASWKWSTLGAEVTGMDSGWSPACLDTPSPSEEAWGVLRTTAVQSLQYVQAENKALPLHLEPRPEAEVRAGDILFTRAGPMNRVAISCLVEATRPRLMLSDKIIRFRPKARVVGSFMALCLNAGKTAEYLEQAKSGMAASQVNISQAKLKAAPIPVPPLDEQNRIVATVTELLALCDQLKARIAAARAKHAQLAEALVALAMAA